MIDRTTPDPLGGETRREEMKPVTPGQDPAGLLSPPPATDAEAEAESFRGFWREWLKPVLLIVLCMTTFRSAIADWNHVPSGSMEPTILVGDRIFVNKIAYDLKLPFTLVRLAQWAEPKRGDLIVFRSPLDGKRLVKRVIGLPGDVLEMRDNRLMVNREPVDYESFAPMALPRPPLVATEVLPTGSSIPSGSRATAATTPSSRSRSRSTSTS